MTTDSGTFPTMRPADDKPATEYQAPIVLLTLGVLSILLLLWTSHESERQAAQHLELEDAVHGLEVAVSTFHLWLEEYLTGDPSIEIGEIWRDLDRFIELALPVAGGGSPGAGDAASAPLREPRLRRQVEALRTRLVEFKNLSVERYRSGAGVGTEMDKSFDLLFGQVLAESRKLGWALVEHSRRSQERSHRRLVAVVGVWALILLAAAAGLWSRERRRRTAEAGRLTGERWLSTTLSSIGDAVIATDLDGTVSFMNPMAEKLTDWELAEALGKPIEEVVMLESEDGTAHTNPVTKVLHSGDSIAMTNHSVMTDRRRERCYSVDEGGAPIRDRDGRLLGAMLIFRDVSRRRQTEEELRQREAELRQAQKMEAVGRLAGGIAHDINNYLGAIRGYCEIVRMIDDDNPVRSQRLDAAMDTASEASALIRQLLAFSRKQPLEAREVIDLNRAVAKMEGLMRQLIGDDVALETDCGEGVWPVEMVPSQVEQILVNLLVNSREAMPLGGKILVTTRNVEIGPEGSGRRPALAPGCYAVLSVTDVGRGIPPEHQDKIFEPFFTTKSDSGSSGLGLATVYGIVQRNRGYVAVESRPGQGTTFEIYLLACEGPVSWRQTPAVAAPAPAIGPVKVLLVEDNDKMRDSLEGLLEALGHEVLVASDAEGALRLLAAEQPDLDLMITDIVMPGLSGPELFGRIREQRRDLRCLFISGYADNVALRHGLRQESTDFLPKPFSAGDLLRKIREILRPSASAPGPIADAAE